MDVENSGVAMNEGDLDAAIDSALEAAGDDELVENHMGVTGSEESGDVEPQADPAPAAETPAEPAQAEEAPQEAEPEAEPEDEDPANVLLKRLAELDPQPVAGKLPEGVEPDSPAGKSFQAQRTLLTQALERENTQRRAYNEKVGQFNEAYNQLRQQNHEMQVKLARLDALVEAGGNNQPQQPQEPQVDQYGRPIPQPQQDLDALFEKKFEERVGPVMAENKRLQEAAAKAEQARQLEEERLAVQQHTTDVCNKTIFAWQDHPVPEDVRRETEKVVYSLAYHFDIPIEQAARQADKLFTSYVAEKMRAAAKAGKARAKTLKKVPDAAPSKGIVAKGGSGYKKTGTGDLGANLDRALNRSAPPPPDEEGIVDYPL